MRKSLKKYAGPGTQEIEGLMAKTELRRMVRREMCRIEQSASRKSDRNWRIDKHHRKEKDLFFRSIPVRVPTAPFKFEGAGAHDFFGLLLTTLRALMALGSHGDQFLKDMTAFALKFINRHIFLHRLSL